MSDSLAPQCAVCREYGDEVDDRIPRAIYLVPEFRGNGNIRRWRLVCEGHVDALRSSKDPEYPIYALSKRVDGSAAVEFQVWGHGVTIPYLNIPYDARRKAIEKEGLSHRQVDDRFAKQQFTDVQFRLYEAHRDFYESYSHVFDEWQVFGVINRDTPKEGRVYANWVRDGFVMSDAFVEQLRVAIKPCLGEDTLDYSMRKIPSACNCGDCDDEFMLTVFKNDNEDHSAFGVRLARIMVELEKAEIRDLEPPDDDDDDDDE